ncbi:MAG: NAD(P)-dependent oxidoreductase [Paludibacteraceae bacterium]|nr:NAD(P)-dependent oxidoreductase [Paludibacteraceae bacterium]
MPRILLTGATGYIGRRVAEQLTLRLPDCRILTLNRDPAKAQQLMPWPQCTHAGARDAAAVQAFRPEVVLHLATLSTSRSDSAVIAPMLEANIHYGVWLLDQLASLAASSDCGSSSPVTFVNVGSFAEYRLGPEAGLRDAYLYTATKSAFRHFVRFYADLTGMRVLTAVPYSVYGGRDTQKKLMDYMLDSMNAPEPVDMTAGEQVLDFVHVDDVVQFFVNVAKDPQALPEGEYHLGTGVGTRVRDLADMLSRLTGKPLHIRWGGRPYRPLDVMHAVAPHNPLLASFWTPRITLETGLRRQLAQQ